MIATKKKQPEPSLADRINELRSDLDGYINQKTMELKNSPSGRGLPTEVLRNMLTRGDGCLCRAAARLLGDPDA